MKRTNLLTRARTATARSGWGRLSGGKPRTDGINAELILEWDGTLMVQESARPSPKLRYLYVHWLRMHMPMPILKNDLDLSISESRNRFLTITKTDGLLIFTPAAVWLIERSCMLTSAIEHLLHHQLHAKTRIRYFFHENELLEKEIVQMYHNQRKMVETVGK